MRTSLLLAGLLLASLAPPAAARPGNPDAETGAAHTTSPSPTTSSSSPMSRARLDPAATAELDRLRLRHGFSMDRLPPSLAARLGAALVAPKTLPQAGAGGDPAAGEPQDERESQSEPDRRRRRTDGSDSAAAPVVKTFPTQLTDMYLLAHWLENDVVVSLFRTFDASGHLVDWNLLRSSDNGASFLSQNNLFKTGAAIDYMFVSPDDTTLLVIDTTHAIIYSSTDDAATWRPSSPLPFTPFSLTFSDLDSNLVVNYEAHTSHLQVSVDAGMTWTGSLSYQGASVVAYNVFWSPVASIYPADTLLVEVVRNSGGSSPYLSQLVAFANLKNLLAAGKDPVGTLIMPTSGPVVELNSFQVVGPYMLFHEAQPAAAGADPSADRPVKLYVSVDRSPFQEADFAGRTYSDYYVVDGSEDELIVGVRHATNLSSLYISERRGVRFSLSLDDVLFQRESPFAATIDLTRVDGVDGVFIASTLGDPDPTSALGRQIITKITFDKGGSWERIQLSSSTTALNLHMQYSADHSASARTRAVPEVLSETSAPGLLLAHGNTGDVLAAPTAASTSVYVSENAGFDWQLAHAGEYFYAMLDHGGVLVLVAPARGDAPVEVLYSLDFGRSWSSLALAQMAVAGIRARPGGASSTLFVFGVTVARKWVFVTIDFAPALGRPCVYPADYTPWRPRDERDDLPCILGESQIIWRRKPAACLSGEDFVRVTNRTSCPCSADDFECDEGFDNVENDCLLVDEGLIPQCGPDTAGQQIEVSRGYRLIARDACSPDPEDERFAPMNVSCPAAKKPCSSCSGGTCTTPTLAGNLRAVAQDSAIKVSKLAVFMAQLNTLPGCSDGESPFGDVTYTWDFEGAPLQGGGGSALTQEVAIVSFDRPGIFDAKVTATNSAGSASARVRYAVYVDATTVGVFYRAGSRTTLGPLNETLLVDAAHTQAAALLSIDPLLVTDVNVREAAGGLVLTLQLLGDGITTAAVAFARLKSKLQADPKLLSLSLRAGSSSTLLPDPSTLAAVADSSDYVPPAPPADDPSGPSESHTVLAIIVPVILVALVIIIAVTYAFSRKLEYTRAMYAGRFDGDGDGDEAQLLGGEGSAEDDADDDDDDGDDRLLLFAESGSLPEHEQEQETRIDANAAWGLPEDNDGSHAAAPALPAARRQSSSSLAKAPRTVRDIYLDDGDDDDDDDDELAPF